MSQNRKLQTEIERVFKKISEGVENFEDIWNKLYSTDNLNQKEKFEADLKKEIKKLQRHRDQIKTWVSSGEIKDKKPLMEQRKLIETQMERFKACEKEMKTKAYSKEGLASNKMDPREKAKMETRKWIADLLDTLSTQIDSYEAELELLQAKKKTSSIGERMEKVDNILERHKFHQGRLELILRLVDNDTLEVDAINPLKDDLTYYTESHEDPDFVEDPGLYDELDLKDDMLDDDYSDDSDDDSDEPRPARERKEKTEAPAASAAAPAAAAPVTPVPAAVPAPAPVVAPTAPAAAPAVAASAVASGGAKGGKKDESASTPAATAAAVAAGGAPTAVATPAAPAASAAPVTHAEAVKGGKGANAATKEDASAKHGKGGAAAAGGAAAGTSTAAIAAAAAAAQGASAPTTAAAAAAGKKNAPSAAAVAAGTASVTGTTGAVTAASVAAKATANDTKPAAPLSTAAVAAKAANASSGAASTTGAGGSGAPTAASVAAGKPSAAAVASGQTAAPATPSATAARTTSNGPAVQPAQPSQQPTAAAVAAGRAASTSGAVQPATPAAVPHTAPASAAAAPAHAPAAAAAAASVATPSVAASLPPAAAAVAVPTAVVTPVAPSAAAPAPAASISAAVSASAASAESAAALQLGSAFGGPLGALGLFGDGVSARDEDRDFVLDAFLGGKVPGVLSDLLPTYESVKAKVSLDNPQQQVALLESSMQNLPDTTDGERLRYYVPHAPQAAPPYYPQAPAAVLDNPQLFEKLDIDTLFFIFYFQQGTYQQYLAARELKKQSWRFHKKFFIWFQRHEEPKAITEEFEQGTYIYFDFETSWCQRKKADFTFNYQFLEDEMYV